MRLVKRSRNCGRQPWVIAGVAAAVLSTASLMAGGSLAANPQPGSADTDKSAQAKPADKDKLVCTEVEVVGSRIPRRICKTAAQVAEDRYHAQQMRDRMRNQNPNQTSPGSGN